jgi:hypothetical protein
VRGGPFGVSVAPGPAHALRLRPPPQPAGCGRAHGPLLVWAVDMLGNPVPGAAFEPLVLADDDADASSTADAADGGGAESEPPPPPPRRPATAARRPDAAARAERPASASVAGRRTPQRVEVLDVAHRARPCACACITARFHLRPF